MLDVEARKLQRAAEMKVGSPDEEVMAWLRRHEGAGEPGESPGYSWQYRLRDLAPGKIIAASLFTNYGRQYP